MDLPLLAKEVALLAQGKDRLVSDAGRDVEAQAGLHEEGHEILGRDVVARQHDGNDERLPIEREDESAAIGLVARVPQ